MHLSLPIFACIVIAYPFLISISCVFGSFLLVFQLHCFPAPRRSYCWTPLTTCFLLVGQLITILLLGWLLPASLIVTRAKPVQRLIDVRPAPLQFLSQIQPLSCLLQRVSWSAQDPGRSAEGFGLHCQTPAQHCFHHCSQLSILLGPPLEWLHLLPMPLSLSAKFSSSPAFHPPRCLP